jgi:hypothetical protein
MRMILLSISLLLSSTSFAASVKTESDSESIQSVVDRFIVKKTLVAKKTHQDMHFESRVSFCDTNHEAMKAYLSSEISRDFNGQVAKTSGYAAAFNWLLYLASKHLSASAAPFTLLLSIAGNAKVVSRYSNDYNRSQQNEESRMAAFAAEGRDACLRSGSWQHADVVQVQAKMQN